MPEEPETSYYNVPGRRSAADPYRGRSSEPPRGSRAPGSDPYARAQDAYADQARFGRGDYGRAGGYDDEYGREHDGLYGGDPHDGRREGRGDAIPAGSRRRAAARSGATGPAERGLPGWLAVIVLIVIAGAAGLIDSLSGTTVRGVFNWGLVVASLVAILIVRRSQMFPVVISPPLVYLAASAGLLYVRTGGLSSRSKILDVGTNWIVYGFPAIAGATAAVLLIAGLRMVLRK